MERFVIAITRTCGSGATTIAKMLADDYSVSIYDRKLFKVASEDSGIKEALFGSADEKLKNTMLYRVSKKVYNGELIPPESGNFTSDNNLFNYQAKVLKELAQRESYIVIGRAADYILKDYPNVFSILLTADDDFCLQHEMEELCFSKKDAQKYIDKTNKYPSDYYTYHTGLKWLEPKNYDLCINTSKLGFEKSVVYIKEYVKLRLESK